MRRLVLPALALCVSTTLPAAAAVTFTEISEQTGLRFEHDPRSLSLEEQNLYGPGVGVEDVNGDGWLDVFFTNGNEVGNRLFLNDGDWTFTDVSAQMGVASSRGGNGLAFGDINNNGRPDLAIANFYEQPILHLNGGDRYRSNETQYGLVPLLPGSFEFSGSYFPAPESMGVSFGDYDQDGFVDVYFAHYRFQVDVVYRNEGGNGFSFVRQIPDAVIDGKDEPFWGFTGVFTDLDDDDDLDLYVANDFGFNFFYENQGAAGGYAFVERARPLGILGDGRADEPKAQSMGLAIADYDNDLDLDIYVTNFQLNALYRNDGVDPSTGDLSFTDVAASAGVEFDLNCWGVEFVDLDNDTDLDLIFTGGHIFSNIFSQPFDIPDQLYINDGPASGWTFTPANESAGFDAGQFGRGLATGDLDRDGDLDVVTTNNTYYDPTPQDYTRVFTGHSMVFRNDQDTGHNWVNLRLEGRVGDGGVTNRMGIGAKVYLTTTAGVTMMREVHAGTSFMSHPSLEVEFGLGWGDVESVQVKWPGGATEEFSGIEANRFYRLIEGQGEATPVATALSTFAARPFARGVLLEWRSAPGVRIVDVAVDRAEAWTPDRFVRLDDVEVTLRPAGGEIFDPTAVPGRSYRYRLALRLESGDEIQSTVAEVTAGTAPAPRRAEVGQNYPNPFNPSTRIEFSLPRRMHARLVIHDARGRLVRTLVDDVVEPGDLHADWAGLDETGRPVSSGVYLYSLITDDGTSARRMVLAR